MNLSVTYINLTLLFSQKTYYAGITENQAKFHEGNSILAYDIPKRTQQDLLDEKEYKDFKDNVELNQNGIPNYLMIGHGMEMKQFEQRDMATTKNLSYEFQNSAKEIISPTTFHEGNTVVGKI